MEFQLHTDFPLHLETEWNALIERSITNVPFIRHEYLRTWWQTRGGGEWPQAELVLVTAHRDGQLVGVAPLFKTYHPQGRASLLLLGSIEISDYLDIIVEPDDLDEFLAGLLNFLASPQVGEWEALDLYNLIDTSPTLAGLERAAAALGWPYLSEKLLHSPYIPLAGDWEAYLAGIDKKQRHEIRRKIRRAEESGEVRWYIVRDAAGLEGEIRAFMAMMRTDPEKEAFFARSDTMLDTMIEITRCAFEHECLVLAFLEIVAKNAAGYLCFDYLNRIWVYNSGFDSSMNDYSPGWVLLGYLLQWANEQKRSEFDFMRGNETYKYRFGAVDRFVMRATVTRK
jgi:CelD/BcsL family acetyltransferase involved in cellulose biosynthesis